MDVEISVDEARLLRLRSQRLHPKSSAATITEAVAGVCGVQAQDQQAAELAVRARCRDLTATQMTTALFEDRSVVRTWCTRGSLHLLTTADLPWMLSIFGQLFADRSRRRLSNLGFDDEASQQAVRQIESSLADHGPLTRSEIVASLRDAGIAIDPDSQAPYHLIRRAALLGVVCEVAPKNGEAAYDLLDRWASLDDPPDRETALGKLARRYLDAFQPATIDDFASWSKLPMADVRKAWESIDGEITTISIEGQLATVLSDDFVVDIDPDPPIVRLLPAFDSYVLGYEARVHTVPAEYDSRVWPGGGIIRPTVTVNGYTIATWKLDRSTGPPTVRIEPFGNVDPELEPSLRVEIDDIGHFLGSNIEYRISS